MEEELVKNELKIRIPGNNIDFFYDGLALASRFYNKRANLAVGRNCMTIGGKTIGLWLEECRKNIDLYNYSQICDLLSMGFYIDNEVPEHQKNWMECYNKVKSLYSLDKNRIVIPKQKDTFGFDIEKWLEDQKKYRSMHSNKYLTSRQIDLLNEINYDWGKEFDPLSNDANIIKQRMLVEIDAIKEELERNHEINKRYTMDYYMRRCEALNSWNTRIAKIIKVNAGMEEIDDDTYGWIMRCIKKKISLTNEQRKVFTALGLKSPIPDILVPDKFKAENNKKVEEEIESYKSKMKHPKKEIEIAYAKKARKSSRQAYWIYTEENYNRGLEVCRRYVEENNKKYLIEPHRSSTNEDILLIKEFLPVIRSAHLRGKLDSSKVKDFEDLKIVWDTEYPNGDIISYFWMAMFLEHKAYYDKNKKLIPQKSTMEAEDGRKMTSWMSSQRRAYREGRLNETQVNLLQSIGMIENKEE